MSEERLRRLEEQVAQLYRHLGLTPEGGAGSGTLDQEVLQLCNSGKKIHAIKLYRDRTGLGLKEAQDAVEAIERRYSLG